MGGIPPILITRVENGYIVSHGEVDPRAEVVRFVAVNPGQLATLVRSWAQTGEAALSFVPDAAPAARPPLDTGPFAVAPSAAAPAAGADGDAFRYAKPAG